jgi:hypothetical protein
MEMKIFENTFPPYEDLQILGILFTSYITLHTTLGNEYIMPKTLAWSLPMSSVEIWDGEQLKKALFTNKPIWKIRSITVDQLVDWSLCSFNQWKRSTYFLSSLWLVYVETLLYYGVHSIPCTHTVAPSRHPLSSNIKPLITTRPYYHFGNFPRRLAYEV